MQGAQRRLDREAKDTAWAVWHVAALSRAVKLPRLNEFVPDGKKSTPKPATWQAQLAAWQSYADRKKVRPGITLDR